MSSELALEDIRSAILILEKSKIKPKKIRTEEQADSANEFDSIFGLEGNWKVGDEYYEARFNPSVVQGILEEELK